jgi:hypothetical protein
LTQITKEEQKVHQLKTLPQYFEKVAAGKKSWELRKNDRDFQENDILILQEFDKKKGYTNRELRVKIIYIFHGGKYGLVEDYCIMSIKRLTKVYFNLTEWKE